MESSISLPCCLSLNFSLCMFVMFILVASKWSMPIKMFTANKIAKLFSEMERIEGTFRNVCYVQKRCCLLA